MPLEAHFSDGGAGTNVTGAVLGVDFLWGETQTAVYAAMVHMETSAGPEHGTSRGEGIGLGGKFGRTFASGLRFEGQLRGGVYSAERSRTVADTDGIRNGSTLYSPLLPAFGSCRRGADRECVGSLAVFGLCLELEHQHRMDEGAY